MRKLVLVLTLALVALVLTADIASACHKKSKGCCYSCCTPCYTACAPCYTYSAPCHSYGCASGYCAAALDATSAHLVVTLPEDAKLLIDEEQTLSTSGTREFTTRGLEAGKDYVYSLKAQVVREGKTLTVTKMATVRAGERTRVSIDLAEEAVVSR